VAKDKTSTRDRAVTRADVARYAGVSKAVVSYVMNGGPRKVAPRLRHGFGRRSPSLTTDRTCTPRLCVAAPLR
jgi:hypothetical protein